MIGGHWTREEKAAYRAAFSRERIGDEVWLLIAFAWTALAVSLTASSSNLVLVGTTVAGLLALYWFTWQVLLPWLERTMPDELRAALPRNRFAGPSSPTSPRTYRELLRRWVQHPASGSDRRAVEQRDEADKARDG